MKTIYKKGFTLIEILIAVAIVGIIAAVAFVALDPAKRFKDSRNAKRWTDVSAIIEAIKVAQVDDGGQYKGELQTVLADGAVRMIVTAGAACAIRALDTDCDVAIPLVNTCVNLTPYVGGYISALPEGPTSADPLRINWNALANETGYYLQKNANGTVTVGSCDGESDLDAVRTVIRIIR